MRKYFLIIAILVLIALFFIFGGPEYLTLASVKNHLQALQQWRAESFLAVALIFFAVYVAVTGLSLPGAAVLTLVAGAIFGFAWGLLIVSFASTIGATLAFLVSRYALRDWVQNKFGQRLQAVNQGVAKDGAFYLLSLRLVPLLPFFMINLVMGLTPIKTWTYYWVSQIGMLAGTAVYVNAGTQLAPIDSLSQVATPAVLMSFVLLGIFPLIARWIMNRIQALRVYRGWQKPKHFDYNVIVIGAGSAGLVSALIGSIVKAKVALIEQHKMGGDCLNTGCVPSKALLKSAKIAHHIRHAEQYGIAAAEPIINFAQVFQRVRQAITEIEPHDSIQRYSSLGVEVYTGRAQLLTPWQVQVTGPDGEAKGITSRAIVIATGAEPLVPPIPGLAEVGVLTSETLWQKFACFERAPERLVILGGGPIGCELAQAFARLGAGVTLVEMASRLLQKEDGDVANFIQQRLANEGVRVLTGHKAEAVQIEEANGIGLKILRARCGDQTVRIEFDEIICALGRKPRVDGFGLETLGIPVDNTVATNSYLQTQFPNIYAAGDVAGPYQFTHTASHQAWYAAVNALFGGWKKFAADYRVIPWVTYTDPEVARVGLSEAEAKAQGVAYELSRYDLADLDRAITESENYGFVKVLTKPGKDTLLGVTIVGSYAGEQLVEFILAMRHGLGLNKIMATIHPYPTWVEANKFAAGEWKKAHAPEKLLHWVAKYHRWRRG